MAQKRFVQLCWSLVLHECAHGLNLDFLTKHNSEAAVGNEDEFFELIDGEEEEGAAGANATLHTGIKATLYETVLTRYFHGPKRIFLNSSHSMYPAESHRKLEAAVVASVVPQNGTQGDSAFMPCILFALGAVAVARRFDRPC